MMKGSRRALKTWGSGLVTADVFEQGVAPDGGGTAVVVLDRAAHLQTLVETGVVGARSRVFAAGALDSGPEPLVMGFEGSLREPGGEVQVGASYFLQTQDYGTSEYLSLIGATLVRVVDRTDLEIFLDDADTARETGQFPEFLTHHLVQLCDVPALGGTSLEDGPGLRLYVDAAGVLSTSPSGLRLGEVGEDLLTLDKEWRNLNGASEEPCAVCLGAAIEEPVRTEAVRARPWLGRYHQAIAGLQHLRGRELEVGAQVRVSGFGGRLVPELEGVADAADDWLGAPTLLWTADSAYVHSVTADRLFRLDLTAGAAAERLLVHGGVEAAEGSISTAELRVVADYFERADVPLFQ